MANISKKISLNVVNQIKPDQTIRDTEIKGFGVRRRGGDASYFLQTRINGRQRWITIGTHGSPWTPISARKEALRLLNEIAGGKDPGLERHQKRTTPTIKQISPEFLEDHGNKLARSSHYAYSLLFKDYLIPAFGRYKVDELDRGTIIRAHNSWREKPRMANFALAVLSKFFSWLEEQNYRPQNSNPCHKIKKYRENRRERYLSSDEFIRLGEVLTEAEQTGSEGPFAIAAIRLLLLTGARLNEILTLKWSEVDLERGLLFLQNSKTGQKTIFLNEAAKAILAKLPRIAKNPHVIVGNKVGSHLVNLQKPWRRIRQLADIEDVRLHDLRHTFASLAASSGASLPLIGRLLGHSQPQTTARYAHLAHDPLKDVNELVGEKLIDVLGLEKN